MGFHPAPPDGYFVATSFTGGVTTGEGGGGTFAWPELARLLRSAT